LQTPREREAASDMCEDFMDIAAAGNAILFVVSLVGLTIFSLIYLTCASHYFLTTITESSSGHDEVQYPRESLIEWWWKPIFTVWVLAFWVIPIAAVCAPLATVSPIAALIIFLTVIWLMYPVSLTSALVTQNWFFFLHPIIAWRMLRHFGAFVYVHLITALAAAACVWFVYAAMTQSILWAIPAVFAIPTTILFYARNWGRFAWLSLNFVPGAKKSKGEAKKSAADTDTVPEMDVQEIDEHAEGIREGLPANTGAGIKVAAPSAAAQYQVDSDGADMETKPYLLVDDPTKPNFQEIDGPPPLAPMPSAPYTTNPPAEEEDEWATEKKPYGLVGDSEFKGPPPDANPPTDKSEADRPASVSKHYDDQHERDKEKKKKAQTNDGVLDLPSPRSKGAPTFANALFFGVWSFMIYERTLSAWLSLVILTAAEMFFLHLARTFFPAG
jgi:hypothetical protein